MRRLAAVLVVVGAVTLAGCSSGQSPSGRSSSSQSSSYEDGWHFAHQHFHGDNGLDCILGNGTGRPAVPARDNIGQWISGCQAEMTGKANIIPG